MKILFTGGSGFIGREIIPLLKNDGHEIFYPSSKELNLLDSDVVDEYFNNNHFDIIIHSAIQGGRRYKKDELDIFFNNIKIFENVFKHAKDVKKFINFDSGASLFNINRIPDSPYGLSKYTIARSVNNQINAVNLRIYGCFGVSEQKNRFFYSNIKNYFEKKSLIIIKDRLMDFIYIKDLYKILKLSLDNNVKDVDCVYEKKYYLSDLSNIINNLDNHKVDIFIENEGEEFSYCGNFLDLSIDFIGIENGIKECYEHFCKWNV